MYIITEAVIVDMNAEILRLRRIHLGPARCAVDLGDGSERASYVPQDYVLRLLGRPHRGISIMFCYYPLDNEWPARISKVNTGNDSGNAWRFSYDDYEPFYGDEPFNQMSDIRRHGQDVILTLTCDPGISDDQIIHLAEQLRPYGRLMLRLNHEADGNWFAFNKRNSYSEVGAFFVRFTEIFHKTAPNIRLILCLGGYENRTDSKLKHEDDFADAIRETDIWSVDQYPSLNWGWPYQLADETTTCYKCNSPVETYDNIRRTRDRYIQLNNNIIKPMYISEYNEDGDVTGPAAQAERIRAFYDMIESSGNWLNGITLYQFRDNGRLGLEVTDPNHPGVGIAQPLLGTYRDIIHHSCFTPSLEAGEQTALPCALRWGCSEDADGVSVTVMLKQFPLLFEAFFDASAVEMSLMIECCGMWFHKAPGVRFVDFMPAFTSVSAFGSGEVALNIFAVPADGRNTDDGSPDWDINARFSLDTLPVIRVKY